MLDLLYTLFIAPLEFWMSKALNWGFDKTDSWGLAIIVMSLVVNIVILPIYLKAEGWQEEERRIRKSFERDEKMIKETFSGQERFAMISTLYRQAGFSPLMTLRSSVGFFLQIPFFFAAYHFLSNFAPFAGVSFWGLADLSKPDEMISIGGFAINVMPILMTVINLGSALVYTQNLSRRDKIQLYGMAGLFLVLLYNAASGLVLYWTCNNIFSLVKNIVTFTITETFKKTDDVSQVDDLGSSYKAKRYTGSLLSNLSQLQDLYWPGILLWLTLVFIYFPSKLFMSDLGEFGAALSEIFSHLIGNWLIAIFFAFLLWWCCRGKVRTILSVASLFLLLTSLIFAFVVEPNYGLMDAFLFQNDSLMRFPGDKYIDLGVSLVVVVLIVVIVKFDLIQTTRTITALLTVAVAGVSISYFVTGTNSETTLPKVDHNEAVKIPTSVTEMFTFSQEGKNVVVLMLDAFTGGNMDQILSKDPSLKGKLDGFTWYEDSLTGGGATIFGKASIFGGDNLQAYHLTTATQQTVEERINYSFAQFLKRLQEENFSISVQDNTWLNKALLTSRVKEKINLIDQASLWDDLPDQWSKKHNFDFAPRGVKYERFSLAYGLFKVLPVSKKRLAYQRGSWLGGVHQGIYGQRHALNWWAQLDSYKDLSQVKTAKNQFKFLINEVTHTPWHMDEKCLPSVEGSGVGGVILNEEGTNAYHIQAEYCALQALTRWFDWMKVNKVYDNTMIVILSDHCRSDSKKLFETWGRKEYPFAAHSLLLVKPFEHRHKLVVDSKTQTLNSDMQSMVNYFLKLSTKAPWEVKTRIRYTIGGDWSRKRHDEFAFKAEKLYRVEGTMFVRENWKKEK